MDANMKEKMEPFIGILINMGLSKMEACGIASMMDSEEMMDEIVTCLRNEEFKLTRQGTLNICGRVIEEHLPTTEKDDR